MQSIVVRSVAARVALVAAAAGALFAATAGAVPAHTAAVDSAAAKLVPAKIKSKGAVSSEVAIALADGIRRRTGATLGVGITGVAGPTGGTPEKPVGTVHVAIAELRVLLNRTLDLLHDLELDGDAQQTGLGFRMPTGLPVRFRAVAS